MLVLALFGALFAGNQSHYTAREIRQQIDQYVRQQYRDSGDRVKISFLQEITDITLGQPADRMAVFCNGIPRGNTVFTVRFFRDEKALRALYLSARVSVFGQVVVTDGVIRRGEPLDAARLKTEEKEITRLPAAPFRTVAQVAGLVAKRNLAAGQIVSEKDVRPPFLVRKGEHLNVAYQKGAVKISLEALALQDGGKNDLIWVKNPLNRRRLRVKVVAKDDAVLP